jgi:predicted AlkP superfamily phosphohydrolase/phosphomutase
VTTKAEVRLVRSTASKVSSGSLRTNVPAITPAAWTSRSTRPASSTTAANPAGSALSAATDRAPTDAAAARSRSSVRAVRTTS